MPILVKLICFTILLFSRKSVYCKQHVIEGDILVHKSELLRNAVNRESRLWPNATIPYKIVASEWRENPWMLYLILDTMNKIEAQTCIRFVPRSDEKSFLVFNSNTSDCSSYIGRIGRPQPIYIGPRCAAVTVAHEIMHAIGFQHAHTRPDRDNFIEILWDNIKRKKQMNFEKANSLDYTTFTQFDFDSIMLYDPYTFSQNRKATLISKVPGIDIRRKSEKLGLSEMDVISINTLYKCDFNEKLRKY
ncbi:Astacin-like metalloprotease toxin [Dinothrombium tinctorium]|uniref:Metalloendopeptidase n=1 Tax=Dinothrombium tinctorium TaxID=1965070 RepID=A0A3S3RYC7_9ACAR|nr:Astacin-like metalloprotease toxin [Dinothrombium tinctorium]